MRSRTAVLVAMLAIAPLRREGRRPRSVVGQGATTRRRDRRGPGDHQPPSSRRPASEVALVVLRTGSSIRTQESMQRWRPDNRPTSRSACDADLSSGQCGHTRTGSQTFDEMLPSPANSDPDRARLGAKLLDEQPPGRRALYALPIGRRATMSMSGASLLEQAGFTLDDVPRQWDAFWSFWCDQVQPAVRRATEARRRHGASALAMSGEPRPTRQAWRSSSSLGLRRGLRDRPTGQLVIDDPEVRRRLIETHRTSYTGGLPKGAAPRPTRSIGRRPARQQPAIPGDSSCVMTPNPTLVAIPAPLKSRASRRLLRRTAANESSGRMAPHGKPLAIRTSFIAAAAFKARRTTSAMVKDFARVSLGRGLARALSQISPVSACCR